MQAGGENEQTVEQMLKLTNGGDGLPFRRSGSAAFYQVVLYGVYTPFREPLGGSMRSYPRTSALVLIVALGFSAPATAAAPGWEHAGYDAENSFYNPGESAINAATVNGLTPRWSVTLRQDEGTCGGPSSPLVAGGLVIAPDDKGITSYRATTGRPAWRFNWDDPDDSSIPSMAVATGVLILGNGDCHSASDPDGMLTALNLTTGKVRWQVQPPTPVHSFVVDKGVVVVSGKSESDEATTVTYGAADGRERWRKPGFTSSSASSAGRILLTKGRSTSAVALPGGTVLWTKPQTWYAESATRTRFLVTTGAALSLVNAASGTLLWTAPGQQSELLATDGRRAYRAVDRKVSALDLRNGRVVWTRTLPSTANQPVRAGGLVYTGGPVLSAASGAVVNRGWHGQQVVTAGRIYLADGNRLTTWAPR